MIIFCILFFKYRNDNSGESRIKRDTDELPKKSLNVKKNRINRETYTTPEPCKGCPGEDGQGVQLAVIHI